MPTHNTFIELAIEVDYDFYGASRGARDRYGAPLEPDEDATVEITEVRDSNGNKLELCNEDLEKIETEIMQEHSK